MATDESSRFPIKGSSGTLGNGRPVRSALAHDLRHAQVFYTDGPEHAPLEFVPTVTGAHQWSQAAAQDAAERAPNAHERSFFEGLTAELKPL